MIDDKQFVIMPSNPKGGESKLFPDNRERALDLPIGFTIVYEKKLKISCNNDKSAILIGNAWQADPQKSSPEEIIQQFNTQTTRNDVYAEECTWCGRYVLIVNGWLYLDFCGTLGIFYSDCNICSSSYRMLCEYLEEKVVYPDTLGDGLLNYVPGPLTLSKRIRRLLPSELLNIQTGERLFRPLLPNGVIKCNSDAERIELFAKYFVCSLQNMAKHFNGSHFWLALTGGRDSRTLMALLERSKIPYKAFTCEHRRISEGDVTLPPRLAKAVGKEHLFIRRIQNQYSKERDYNYRTHTAGLANDGDKPMYAYGQYDELDKNNQVVLLRSSIWGNCIEYYKKHLSDIEISEMEKNFDVVKIYPKAKNNDAYVKSLQTYVKEIKNDQNNSNINIWNRCFLEQRHGAWISSIEQGFDMMDGKTSVQCCNSRIFFSYLFDFPDKDRKGKIYEEKIIAHLCPPLSRYRFVYNLTLKKRIKNTIHSILNCFKK